MSGSVDSSASAEEASNRGSPAALASLGVAVVAALVLMSRIADRPQADFADAALGADTTSIYAKRGGALVHIRGPEEVPELVEGLSARAADRTVVWLGNSQLHAINQAGPGEEPASAQAHDALIGQGVDLVAASFPNANLQEHLLAVAYLLEKTPRLSAIVLPVVFDDLRETGIRDELKPMLSDQQTADLLGEFPIGEQLLSEAPTSTEEEATDADLAALDNTFQERTETFLNEELEERWPLWAARKQARGTFFIRLYEFRNYMLGITPQSKRRLLKPRYDANMAALTATLDLAANAGVTVLVYVAPLRTDVEPPYVMSEYSGFKQEAERFCAGRPGVRFVDLEPLVPGEYWGEKASTTGDGEKELDFMHFQEPGHKLLADRIVEEITSLLPGADR